MIEIATHAAETDHKTRADYDAERVSCLALLGRENDAAAAIDAVIESCRDISATSRRDSIFDSLKIALDDVAPVSVLQGLIRAAAAERPDIVAHAAVHLARHGRSQEASDAIRRVLEQTRLADASTRTPVLFQSARALAALNRSDEATQCVMNALDTGRTLAARDYPFVLSNLAEALADLGHREGVSSLVNTLATTVAWWDHHGS